MTRTLVALLLAGCAAMPDPVIQQARRDIAAGRGEQALDLLQKTAKENPSDHRYRTEYLRSRDQLLAEWLTQAELLRLSQPAAARERFRQVLAQAPENARARAGLGQLDTDERHRQVVASAEALAKQDKLLEALELLRPVLVDNPQQRDARRLQRAIEERTVSPSGVMPRLKASNTQPMSLELRDVSLRGVLDVITRGSGVNFVLDRDVRADQKTTLVMRHAPTQELIRAVLASNQLEQKVIGDSTVLLFPNTPQKLREYQELVIKSFYLTNADARQTANLIRAMVKTRDLHVDEKLNLLVIKDTPGAMRLAERLIQAQDLAEPEVMLEVEVLEVGSNRLLELGLRFPDAVGLGVTGAGGTAGNLTWRELRNLNQDMVQLSFTNPLFLLNLRQQDGSTNVLANPRIRVRNKEKARIHIGDRVPVITTTAAATGGFVSESVTYLDIGLKLEVEPLIHLDDEVGIKVSLEVSNIAREIRGNTTNTLAYQIGTRNANTVLRLRDGETQVLAGLINDEDRRSASRVPGLGDLPVLGRLFSQTRDDKTKTEIVLLITPRLVRTLARPDARTAEFAAGTEASSGSGSGLPQIAPQVPLPSSLPTPPAQPSPPSAAPAKAPAEARPASSIPMIPFGGVKPPGQ